MDNFLLFNRIISKRLLLHTLFWVMNLMAILAIIYFVPGADFWKYCPRILVIFSLIIGCSYINLLVLIPKYFTTKKYWKYLIGLLLNISLFSFLKVFLKLIVIKDPIDNNLFEEISTAIVLMIFYCLFTFSMKIIREWFSLQDVAIKLRETEKQKLEAELTVLKAQLNPHFMFNTLNNIYSLSLDKSDRAPDLILKLSELMNYTLYECNDDFIPVSKEIDFIRNYIELEKVRLRKDVKVMFDVMGNYENTKVAPLLFIPFIENAFKHGVNQRPDDPYINIIFDFTIKKLISFTIENSKPTNVAVDKKQKGIGIENVRKRLNLLYPNRYRLNINDSGHKYNVELRISVV